MVGMSRVGRVCDLGFEDEANLKMKCEKAVWALVAFPFLEIFVEGTT